MIEKIRIADKKRIAIIMIFALLPLIAAMVYPMLSGASFFRLDAFMAKWNDERNYYSKVLMIHEHFFPQGINGYNESVPKKLGYGVYRPQIFVTYALLSFLTGVSSRNFMYYCNILLAVIANALFVGIAKPDGRRILRLSVFMLSQVIYMRYCVSGMSETNSCAFAIFAVACSCAFWNRADGTDDGKAVKRERAMLIVYVAVTFYYGLIRPQNLAYMLIPIVYIWLKKTAAWKKAAVSAGIFLLSCSDFVLYRYTSNWHSPYHRTGRPSSTTKFVRTLKNLLHGEIKPFLRELLSQNKAAVEDIVAALKSHAMRGWIVLIFLILIAGLIALAVIEKKHRILCIVYLVIGLCTYEATIFLYMPSQLHRMLLAYVISTGYLICMLCGEKAGRWLCGLILAVNIVLAVCIFVVSPSIFKIPQAVSEIDEARLRREFSEVFERSPEGGWYNTVAVCSAGSEGTVKGSIRYRIPSYMGYTSCQKDYMIKAIEENTVKSRYIYVGDTSEVRSLCDEKYELLWSDYGLCVYRTY